MFNFAFRLQFERSDSLVAWLKPDMIHLYGLYELSFPEYLARIGYTGFGSLTLWFLCCLILCYLMAWTLGINISIPATVRFILLLIIIIAFPLNILGFFVWKWYGIFFLIGYAIHYYTEKYDYSLTIFAARKSVWLSLVLFPLCAYLFNWMIPWQNADYGTIGLAAVFTAILNGHAGLIGVMFLMALLGTGFVYCLARLLPVKALSYLGSISIGIYLLHIMFVGLFHNYWLSAVVALAISITLYEIWRRAIVQPFFASNPR